MTPQELKNSILQLAIQGKLVEQRAEDGTAAEKKTGKVRYFSDLTALRLEQLDGAVQVPGPADPNSLPPEPDDGDMPF